MYRQNKLYRQVCRWGIMLFLLLASVGSGLAASEPGLMGPGLAGPVGQGVPSFKVLVLASRASDHVKMIAAARPYLEKMAAANHFTLEFTDDTSRINDDTLAGYQVFVMLHLAPFDMSQQQQEALQKFVLQGKGWVGIHAAGLTGKSFLAPQSRYWQWFEEFMGGVIYSPHPAYQHGSVIVEDHEHPVARNLPERFDLSDEWYEFNKSPRGKVRVLISADESTYKQNKPMGDHPLVWTNERYRRMIYIGLGHDPSVFGNDPYTTLLRNAILWAGSGSAGKGVWPQAAWPPIPMKGRIIDYTQQYALDQAVPKAEVRHRVLRTLAGSLAGSGGRIDSLSLEQGDTIKARGLFKVPIDKGANARTAAGDGYYWLRFDMAIKIQAGGYTFRAFHYYEDPVNMGITNDYSKIEYRWWDFRQGKPWSSGDRQLFNGLDSMTRSLMDLLYAGVNQPATFPRFKAIALYENGGHHIEYSKRAKIWLDQLAADSNFAIDYIQNTDSIDETFLNKYQLFIQLDYAPYAWKDKAVTAFKRYIEEGRGGWIGFHHATLLGEFDGYPMWEWFSQFMGGVRFKSYIPSFARGEVHVEDGRHPVMKDVPDSFLISKEEWYTYDKSPRANVHVLASVDESSYQPDTDIKMGDHPVIWTNEHVKARNVYIFMGHSPILLDEPAYKKIVSNAIFWAAATVPAVTVPAPQEPKGDGGDLQAGASDKPFKVLAFYSTDVEADHVDFAKDAIAYYTKLATEKGFTFDTTTDWTFTDDAHLRGYQVVMWLNDFPKTAVQRSAFERYMHAGGAWLGFHVSAYNDRDTNWPWFVDFLGGAIFYNNNWPPLPAAMIVDDRSHPVTSGLPSHYIAPINEWYGWRPNPRLNKDVTVLVTLDPVNYPLGKKDILRSADIPVVWTNTRYKMLYMNMGHGDHIFTSPLQNTLFQNAVLWLGGRKTTTSSTLSFYINQAGFNDRGPKLAVVQADAPLPAQVAFTLVDITSGKVVFRGKLDDQQQIGEWMPGKWLYHADLSSFNLPGRYKLAVVVEGHRYVSDTFRIGGHALARSMISAIIHYYNRQRANTPVEWAADEHLRLYGSDKTVDMRGGWCDASGDVSKYFSHLAYANFLSPQQTPLVTWSMVSTDETIPSLLQAWGLRDSLENEALWGADYMMRALSDSGFFRMIVFSYFNKDPGARRVVGLHANSVTTNEYQCAFREGGGMAIAALARISQWEKHGVFTSRQYLEGAKLAFDHLLINNTRYDDDGKENIIDDYCALMAATELWIATGETRYRDEARKRADKLSARMTDAGYFLAGDSRRPFWHASDAGLPVVALARYAHAEKDPEQLAKALHTIKRALDYELRVTDEVSNPFGYARQSFLLSDSVKDGFFIPHENETGWWWQGENARLGSLATAALVGGRLVYPHSGGWGVKDPLAVFAARQLDWILGSNPYAMCFMYQFGRKNVPYMQSNFGHGSEKGGISNGITGKGGDGSGIDFRTTDEGNEWRWTEQWLPHAAWFLQALAAIEAS